MKKMNKCIENLPNNSIGDRLRILRIQHGYTQAQISEKFYMTSRHYQKYESGTTPLSADYAIMFADFYDVSTEYILRNKSISVNENIANLLNPLTEQEQAHVLSMVKILIDMYKENTL